MQLFFLHRYHPVRDLRFAETVFSKLPECSLEKVCPPVNRRHAHMTIGMEKKPDPVETTEGIVVPMGPVGDAGSNGGGGWICVVPGEWPYAIRKIHYTTLEDEEEWMNGTSSEAGKKCIASGRIMSPEAWNYRPDKDASE